MPGLLKQTTKLPSAPPMEANDVAIVTGGTVLWLIGFLVLLPFHSSMAAHGRGDWQWICLAGFGLGLIGIWYCRARREAIRRRAAQHEAAEREAAEPGAAEPGAGREATERAQQAPEE